MAGRRDRGWVGQQLAVVLSAALLWAVGACRIGGVEPLPIRGAPPAVIAVWPLVGGAIGGAVGEDVAGTASLGALDLALRQRGYQVVPDRVAAQLLAAAGLAAANVQPQDVGPVLQADAVLCVEVRDWQTGGDRVLQTARWDIRWQLVSTRGLGVQWSYDHHGAWQRRSSDPFDDSRQVERTAPLVPIGGDRSPGFGDAAELLAWLHRGAIDHLPRIER